MLARQNPLRRAAPKVKTARCHRQGMRPKATTGEAAPSNRQQRIERHSRARQKASRVRARYHGHRVSRRPPWPTEQGRSLNAIQAATASRKRRDLPGEAGYMKRRTKMIARDTTTEPTTDELRAAFNRSYGLHFLGYSFEKAIQTPTVLFCLKQSALRHRAVHSLPVQPRLI